MTELRYFPHQYEGVAWLDDPALPHRMLASDPGLGKTIMGIGAADALGASRILVICPPAMRATWKREIAKWQEHRRPVSVCETTAEVIALGKRAPKRDEWVILGWTQTPLAHKSWPAGVTFDLILVDEAHYGKNPEAERTRAVYGKGCKGNGLVLRSPRVGLLTGTPILNAPHELWPHYRALWPQAMGTERPYSYAGWLATFCDVHQGVGGVQVRGVKIGMARQLRDAFAPFILRQRKTPGMLPPLMVNEVPLSIDGRGAAEAKRLSREVGLFNATLDQVQAVLDASGVVYLASLRRVLGTAKAKPAADLILADLAGGVESAVVFAWHRETLDALALALVSVGVLRLDCSVAERDARVQQFQAGGRERVALAQIVSGGVGITLTRASDVYLVEQAWTPAENAQAVQRCHRIGQARPVNARFLYAEGTVDEALAAVLARKARTMTLLGLD